MAGEILFSKCTLVILESWNGGDCALCRTFQKPLGAVRFSRYNEAGMEVPPMTRTEAIKEFFKKAVLPVAIAGLLYCIFKSACIRNGELDLLWLWILCGLPFGI